MQLTLLRDALLRVSSPYSHLYHPDGSLYMERFIVKKRRGQEGSHIRLHHIVTEDFDDHLHDHPFSFGSLVLTGGYIEALPITRSPCFSTTAMGQKVEKVRFFQRWHGSFAYRHAWDRHKIMEVAPDTWTLVFAGPLRQWWGFYTPEGKIHHEDYASVHSTVAREER